MDKGELITSIDGVNFYYGGWNKKGWHLVFTSLENFHVGNNILQPPTKRDCERIYRNLYKEKTKFEVYENGGGGIALFILNNYNVPIEAFGNIECQHDGYLSECISEIDTWRTWDGKITEEIKDWLKDERYLEYVGATNIQEYYSEWSNPVNADLVVDNKGIRIGNVGAAACNALGMSYEERESILSKLGYDGIYTSSIYGFNK